MFLGVATKGGSPIFFVLAIVGMIAIVVVGLARHTLAPFDGKGPAVRGVPRVLRPGTNRLFQRRGWAAPYDANGTNIPRGERQIPPADDASPEA